MNTELAQSVFKALAYFDLFNYPLTKEELYNFLWQPPAISYADFLLSLRDSALESKFGYFFLPGRPNFAEATPGKEENIEIRRKRLVISDQKLKIARKAAKKIRSVPFIKAIFICNSVGAEAPSRDSDIDFLIVTSKKHVWIARFFANLILRIFGLRIYGASVKDKICLSFFLDEEHLNLSSIKIADEDVYLTYWIYRITPIYDPQNFYAKFIEANEWTKYYLPNARGYQSACRLRVCDSFAGKIWKKCWEAMWSGGYGDLIEKQAKGLQIEHLKKTLKESGAPNGVALGDGMIKLHENDARSKYREEWKKRLPLL